MAFVTRNYLAANSNFVTIRVAYRPRTLKCITQRVFLGDTAVGFCRGGGCLSDIEFGGRQFCLTNAIAKRVFRVLAVEIPFPPKIQQYEFVYVYHKDHCHHKVEHNLIFWYCIYVFY